MQMENLDDSPEDVEVYLLPVDKSKFVEMKLGYDLTNIYRVVIQRHHG
jgi:hypothetical protein